VADLRHCRCILIGHHEIRARRLRPLDEQPHCIVLGQLLEAWNVLPCRQRERRHHELVLAGEVQRGPAGHEGLDITRSREQPGDMRRGLQHLLEVVQQQQHLLFAQVGCKVFRSGWLPA